MAASTSPTTLEAYMRMNTEPDCEYVAGVIEERAVGEYDHATWQAILAGYFNARGAEWRVKARVELRVQVSADTFRVPDVTVLSADAPREPVITHAPLAVFEILSPEDTMTRMLVKLAGYEGMGIGAIWVIEPKKPAYWRYFGGKLEPARRFELPGTAFGFAMEQVARLID